MVDFTGKQDRGTPAENDLQSVRCLHNNGDLTPLHDASKQYYQPVCNPRLGPGETGGCQHRKECLALHMQKLYGSEHDHPTAVGEEPHPPKPAPRVDIDRAFLGLPHGNQVLQSK